MRLVVTTSNRADKAHTEPIYRAALAAGMDATLLDIAGLTQIEVLARTDEVLRSVRAEVMLLLGDRLETLTAALAAIPLNVALAHVCGGDITEGSADDAMRHALTKLSHIHFPSTDESAARLLQMGEEASRIYVVGDPSLDGIEGKGLLPPTTTEPPLLVTLHPDSIDPAQTKHDVAELVAALENETAPIIFTAPNGEAGSDVIRAELLAFTAAHPNAIFVESLGAERYFSAMRHAAAMVGNSSSGILEAASFRLPVVNLGERQRARQHGDNVIHAACERRSIKQALAKAVSPDFRAGLSGKNPYYCGGAVARIIQTLQAVSPDRRKKFVERPSASSI